MEESDSTIRDRWSPWQDQIGHPLSLTRRFHLTSGLVFIYHHLLAWTASLGNASQLQLCDIYTGSHGSLGTVLDAISTSLPFTSMIATYPTSIQEPSITGWAKLVALVCLSGSLSSLVLQMEVT